MSNLIKEQSIIIKEVENENLLTLESNIIRVTFDSNFPRIVRYLWKEDDSILHGQEQRIITVNLNGEPYIPMVKSNFYDSEIKYTLDFNEIDVVININFAVYDNAVNMEFTSIEENGDFKLRYIDFPNHSLVSVRDTEEGEFASSWTIGDWNNINEEYELVKNAKTDGKDGHRKRTYGFLNNKQFAATLNNNVIDGSNRIVIDVKDTFDGYKKASLSNGTWTYREVLNTDENKSYLGPEELPWCEIRIGKDLNDDNLVDWQDAAILYRDTMINRNAIPKGYEDIRNCLSYISFNIGSLVQSPFLRALDMIKKVSNYTDNFGQLVLAKGYQAEGHDDSHADLGGHIGIRQGGKKDFRLLTKEAQKYNAKIGVHINVTEYMLDSFSLDYKVLKQPLAPGWSWLDKSYYVDKKYDITSGELYKRMNMLKEDAPDLKWIYVDVYSGNNWESYKLYNKINDNGWMAATEFAGPMEQGVLWTHWGTDPAYPNQGNGSKIMRFIKNTYQDTFLKDPLIKGNQQLLLGGWGNEVNLSGSMEVFYNHVLVSKYLQHFPIMKMEENKVTFDQGVCSVREDNKVNIYKDNKIIAITSDSIEVGTSIIFIPWSPIDEDKIYHWNYRGGTTTWDLPESWSNLTEVYFYELNDLGKKLLCKIPVVHGKVVIESKEKTPYLLLKEVYEDNKGEMNWGEGGFIKDPGFDSQSFKYWKIESSSNSTNHISLVKDNHEKRRGNDLLKIKGRENAIISQDIYGLKPGRTYSASVWVKVTGSRKVTLGIKDYGGEDITNYIDRPADVKQGEGVKFLDDTFTRLKVDFTVPKEHTTANLYLDVDSSISQTEVYADDFRIWENPGFTDRRGYILYEDFENIDEGWGPFYLAVPGTSVRGHMVEKSPNNRQHVSWVIDGNFSFKTNQQPDEVGEMIKTEQSTLKLAPNKTYELGFLYTVKEDKLYSVKIKSASSSHTPLNLPIRNGKNMSFVSKFTTGEKDDYYLSIDKKHGFDELIIDNIYIKEI